MGPAAEPAGVTFLVRPFTRSGERVAHGLVMRYGALDCVNDNARRLQDADFPVDGSIIAFGSHRVYVAVVTDSYHAEVLNCNELPPAGDSNLSCSIDDLCDRVEVFTVTSHGGASGYRTPIHAAMDTLHTHPKSLMDTACSCSVRRKLWRLLSASSKPLSMNSTRPMVSCRLPPGPTS
ncbi:DNA mismatch repair protein Mlh1 [Hordeum vulgare]|nr:DNA mismatch repair protein Mlh1 [Hordeum vulgare]